MPDPVQFEKKRSLLLRGLTARPFPFMDIFMIRLFEPRDTDAVMVVWRAASDLAHPFLSKTFQDASAILIRQNYLHISDIWVAEEAGEVVGFIGLLDDLIGGLFVHPDYHGRGIGRALVDRAVAERGSLCVEVFVDNPIGRRFYAAYGFKGEKQVMDPHSGFPLLQLCYEAEDQEGKRA